MIVEVPASVSAKESLIMQTSPTSSPDASSEEVAAVLRVLADATRLRVFLLLRQGETCVCEMATALGLAENLISHHLGVLRRAGLVEARRDPSDARWVYYQLKAETLARLLQELGGLFDPQTIGTRTPTCGPAALLMPERAKRSSTESTPAIS
jgi:ArsR family transcriptional regulator, arsenate/arsenite/antimonite-responsive transcriptional repressor